MRHIPAFENPTLSRVIRHQWKFSRICFALVTQVILLLVICQLLFLARMGRYTDLIFLSEALLILIVSPYLACSGLNAHFEPLMSSSLLQLSRMRSQQVGFSVIVGSQIYTFCFLGIVTLALIILIPLNSTLTYFEVLRLQTVIGLYIIVAALVAGVCWHGFRHEIYATGVTYLAWSLLIGSVFLLAPLDRYLDNLEPIIPVFLHLNPLMAVCNLLQIDVFRTPHLYELTPIPSYRVVYPAWHVVCTVQILIAICCMVLTRWHSLKILEQQEFTD